MKDLFSDHAGQYAHYRPTYPSSLFEFLHTIAPSKNRVWDCGTGNGQMATELAPYFKTVYASDISEAQIKEAPQATNVHYSVQLAESTDYPNAFFDLIVVAQAVHWFRFGPFYKEVRRVLKERGVLAVIGYGLFRTGPEVDSVIDRLYYDKTGPYWDEERKYIDDRYQTIPFPFYEIKPPSSLSMKAYWTIDQLVGYLETWSAVQHFIEKKGENPVQEIKKELSKAWGSRKEREITFPLFLRVGRLKSS